MNTTTEARRDEGCAPTAGSGPFEVKTAGTARSLKCHAGINRCGDIEDGIGFQFDNEGWFVLPLSELHRIVALAHIRRQNTPPSGGASAAAECSE